MAHVWQQTHGTPLRRCYHYKEGAAKMKEIGLQPSTTGEPGGKENGQSVTHYLIPGGPLVRAYAKLAATDFQLNWPSVPFDGGERREKAASKTKYTCPMCGANAWAKPETQLICGACYEEDDGEITLLEPETAADQQEAA